MNFHSYIIIAIFSLFLFSSKTRATASVLLFAYVIYYFCAVNLKGTGLLKYMVFGTLEVFAGVWLLHGHKLMLHRWFPFLPYHQDNSIAETYFISVFVNVLGGILYWNYYPPKYYDNMCITLMIIQIIILTWRVFKDGRIINRCSLLHPLFGAFVSNINQRYSFLQTREDKS